MDATKSLRVCIVEDDRDTAESTSMPLRLLGHQPLVTLSGESALLQAPDWRPDVMRIDLAMPKMDGCALAAQLRGQPGFDRVPLVAVSGYVDFKHRQQAAESGFDEFLNKPYLVADLEGLFARVRMRVLDTQTMVEQTRAIAEDSRDRNRRSREGLDD